MNLVISRAYVFDLTAGHCIVSISDSFFRKFYSIITTLVKSSEKQVNRKSKNNEMCL